MRDFISTVKYNFFVGSPELTASKFRQCPKSRGLGQHLSVWAWILVIVGAMLLLLLILGGVLAFIRNSKRGSAQIHKSVSESRRTDEPGNNQIYSILLLTEEFIYEQYIFLF